MRTLPETCKTSMHKMPGHILLVSLFWFMCFGLYINQPTCVQVLCRILTPARLLTLVLVGLGLGLGVRLGLGNQVAISTRGVIIWQGVENGHNTGL